ncbi:MAG: hypothetical protein ACODAQ_08820, partial [Phycisphaeraceae bacterium]
MSGETWACAAMLRIVGINHRLYGKRNESERSGSMEKHLLPLLFVFNRCGASVVRLGSGTMTCS